MNYFEHHIGDYAEATSHLSFVEDAAYSRCIRKYYAKEKPLPADLKAVQRLVGARTKEEKEAVEAVLTEFFVLGDDGWRNSRCDADIAAYQAGEPEREAKKANEETRLKRHREERAALFQRLTAAGQHAAWNTTMKELRALVKALPETGAATAGPETPETQPATAPATPVTATQTPIPNTHTPSIHTSLSANSADAQLVDGDGVVLPKAEKTPKYTDEDVRCAEWIFDRILKTNPNHSRPKFAKWADEVRLLRDGKKVTHRDICEMFDWAHSDSFWRANILSPSKLREKWDQLNIKRGTPQKGQQHDNFSAQDYRAGVRPDGSF